LKKYLGIRKNSFAKNKKMISNAVKPPRSMAIPRGKILLAGKAISNEIARMVSVLLIRGLSFLVMKIILVQN
jgi:hypothetical protein